MLKKAAYLKNIPGLGRLNSLRVNCCSAVALRAIQVEFSIARLKFK